MGTCQSLDDGRYTAQGIDLDSFMQSTDRSEVELLIMGPKGSGKSTLAIQSKILAGHGIEPRLFTDQVRNSTVRAMADLVEGVWSLNLVFSSVANRRNAVRVFGGKQPEYVWDDSVGEVVVALAKDSAIQEALRRRNELSMPENGRYFIENLDRISRSDYVPNSTDVMTCHQYSEAARETHLSFGGMNFKLMELGTGLDEVKRMLPFFDSIITIVYVIDVSQFDVKDEDTGENVLQKAIKELEVLLARWLQNTSVILFWNKMDLLDDKVSRGTSLISTHWPEYTGNRDARTFIEFLNRQLPQPTCGADYAQLCASTASFTQDTNFAGEIFTYVRNVILQNNLRREGYM